MTDPFERAVAREELARRSHKTRLVEMGWRYHLGAYLSVHVLLVVVWLATTGPDSHPWPLYSLAGWGIGLFFHWSSYRSYRKRDLALRAQLDG